MKVNFSASPVNWGLREGIYFATHQFTNYPNVTVSYMEHTPDWHDSIKITGEVSDDQIDEFQDKINKLSEICEKVI